MVFSERVLYFEVRCRSKLSVDPSHTYSIVAGRINKLLFLFQSLHFDLNTSNIRDMFKMRSTSHESCIAWSARYTLDIYKLVHTWPNCPMLPICYQRELSDQKHGRVNLYGSRTTRFFWKIRFRNMCLQIKTAMYRCWDSFLSLLYCI